MDSLAKALTALAGVAFVMAVISNFVFFVPVTAEGFSRAATNFALLAIALVLCFRSSTKP